MYFVFFHNEHHFCCATPAIIEIIHGNSKSKNVALSPSPPFSAPSFMVGSPPNNALDHSEDVIESSQLSEIELIKLPSTPLHTVKAHYTAAWAVAGGAPMASDSKEENTVKQEDEELSVMESDTGTELPREHWLNLEIQWLEREDYPSKLWNRPRLNALREEREMLIQARQDALGAPSSFVNAALPLTPRPVPP
ncbi:hypothetical protein CPB84DRAFT_1756219, partial [Gymnopilus junonius]